MVLLLMEAVYYGMQTQYLLLRLVHLLLMLLRGYMVAALQWYHAVEDVCRVFVAKKLSFEQVGAVAVAVVVAVAVAVETVGVVDAVVVSLMMLRMMDRIAAVGDTADDVELCAMENGACAPAALVLCTCSAAESSYEVPVVEVVYEERPL